MTRGRLRTASPAPLLVVLRPRQKSREPRIASEWREVGVPEQVIGGRETPLDRIAQAGERLVPATEPRLRAGQVVGEEHARREGPALLVARARRLGVSEQHRGQADAEPGLPWVLLRRERLLELGLGRLAPTQLQELLAWPG